MPNVEVEVTSGRVRIEMKSYSLFSDYAVLYVDNQRCGWGDTISTDRRDQSTIERMIRIALGRYEVDVDRAYLDEHAIPAYYHAWDMLQEAKKRKAKKLAVPPPDNLPRWALRLYKR